MILKLATENVFTAVPPETLFHYTNQKGLLGIVESKSIWLTHADYLNDRSEFFHAIKIVRDQLGDRIRTAKGIDGTLLQEMLEGVAGYPIRNVCVCSFSEDGDSLSQWRAYGGPTSGFAVGIPGDLVQRVTALNGYYLARCIYKPSEKRDLVAQLLDVTFQENLERHQRALAGTPEPEDEDMPPGGNLAARLNRYAAIMKNFKFRSEREWRVISRPTMARHLSFREGKSTIVPYLPMTLELERYPFSLNELTVGPTPDPSRAVRAAANLLVSNGLRGGADRGATVAKSKVPYRNW